MGDRATEELLAEILSEEEFQPRSYGHSYWEELTREAIAQIHALFQKALNFVHELINTITPGGDSSEITLDWIELASKLILTFSVSALMISSCIIVWIKFKNRRRNYSKLHPIETPPSTEEFPLTTVAQLSFIHRQFRDALLRRQQIALSTTDREAASTATSELGELFRSFTKLHERYFYQSHHDLTQVTAMYLESMREKIGRS